MYRRFHTPYQGSHRTSTLRRTGVGQAGTQTEGDWTIQVTRRVVGASIRRELFAVRIVCRIDGYEERLSGYKSKSAALEAARVRVDLLKYTAERAARRQAISKNRPSSTA